jgi:hypothetical protein
LFTHKFAKSLFWNNKLAKGANTLVFQKQKNIKNNLIMLGLLPFQKVRQAVDPVKSSHFFIWQTYVSDNGKHMLPTNHGKLMLPTIKKA